MSKTKSRLVGVVIDEPEPKSLGEFDFRRVPCVGEIIAADDGTFVVTFVSHDVRSGARSPVTLMVHRAESSADGKRRAALALLEASLIEEAKGAKKRKQKK